jgi:hypothetical protein
MLGSFAMSWLDWKRYVAPSAAGERKREGNREAALRVAKTQVDADPQP